MLAEAIASAEASVLEVFASRQGEGLFIGEEQLFVRFGGCNLHCDYCDTPQSIPLKSGRQRTVEDVAEEVISWESRLPNKVVSLTGGEPLVQVRFLESLIPLLKGRGWKIYLETNGALPNALARIVDDCHWIAMDYKFESAVQHDLMEAHQWFLKVGGSKVFVKMVLTDRTNNEEFRRGVQLIAQSSLDTPLILQPATPTALTGSIPLEALNSWWLWAASQLNDVRVLPQVHKLWGLP